MNLLEDARLRINDIDSKMAALFELRMQAVADVAKYKEENGIPVFDSSREVEVIEKNRKFIKDPQYEEFYIDFLQHTMDVSKRYQKKVLEDKDI